MVAGRPTHIKAFAQVCETQMFQLDLFIYTHMYLYSNTKHMLMYMHTFYIRVYGMYVFYLAPDLEPRYTM